MAEKKAKKLGSRRKPVRTRAHAASHANESVPLHDLLEDRFLGVTFAGGRRESKTLPEVLHLLGGGDEIEGFTALQAHQQHAWHAFLVQLAAVALQRGGEEKPSQRPETWRELLLALTRRRHEAWTLVVPDLSLPGFMQPPVPEGELDAFKTTIERPDELDVLVTSKNHDVKAARSSRARPEHWAYALVSLQTMQGFSGRMNYGIARMNGGVGSRPGLGLSPGHSLGARFKRDVEALLAARDTIAADREYPRRGGIALLWLESWNGRTPLELQALDPYFIEICRRVRLAEIDGRLLARASPTDASRVEAGGVRGNTGDPWTPVHKTEGKAFTATELGFAYRVVHRLMGDEYVQGVAQEPRPGEQDLVLVASVLARGMGKTGGYHERRVPVPAAATRWLRAPDRRAALAERARARVQLVADVQRQVLKPAILVLLQGAPGKLNFKDERGDRWLAAHDADVDAVFFERLWADLERPPEEGRRAWAKLVLDLARERLRDAMESAPVPSMRRFRAMADAERVFEGAARKRVPIAFEPKEERDVV